MNLNTKKLGSSVILLALTVSTLTLFQNCAPSFTSNLDAESSTGGGGGKFELGNAAFTAAKCADPSSRGASEALRRLSKSELTNTLSDVFGQDLTNSVASLAIFPNDVMKESVNEFAQAQSSQQIESLFEMSTEIAKLLRTNRTYLSRVAPSCVGAGLDSNSLNDTCLQQFISEFGFKVHRRPLTSARIQSYLNDYKATSADLNGITTADRFEILAARILQAPEFIYHLPVEDASGTKTSQRIKVDAYTVANRLAYRFTGYPPDQALYDAAKNGALNSLDGAQTQAMRLISTNRGRARVGEMFHHWLKLDKVFAPNINVLINLGYGNNTNLQQSLRAEMVTELKEFADHIIFDENGTFSDLMKSPKGVPRSDAMARILGLPTVTRGPASTNDSRMGLIMRPALLAGTGNEREEVINRGIRLRMRVLCENVPPPPGDADVKAAENLNGLDVYKMSTRQIANATTGSGTCVSCHKVLNSMAYGLGHFGPLGEFRSSEKIFNAQHVVVADLPINAAVDAGLSIVNIEDRARDHVDLANLMAESPKARQCLVQYAFRFSRLRFEGTKDGCQISEAQEILAAGGSVKEALVKTIASEDIFWRGNQ